MSYRLPIYSSRNKRTLRNMSKSKATGADWPTMNRSMKELCNPHLFRESKQLGGFVVWYVVGLANPFKNHLPFVPWL